MKLNDEKKCEAGGDERDERLTVKSFRSLERFRDEGFSGPSGRSFRVKTPSSHECCVQQRRPIVPKDE